MLAYTVLEGNGPQDTGVTTNFAFLPLNLSASISLTYRVRLENMVTLNEVLSTAIHLSYASAPDAARVYSDSAMVRALIRYFFERYDSPPQVNITVTGDVTLSASIGNTTIEGTGLVEHS